MQVPLTPHYLTTFTVRRFEQSGGIESNRWTQGRKNETNAAGDGRDGKRSRQANQHVDSIVRSSQPRKLMNVMFSCKIGLGEQSNVLPFCFVGFLKMRNDSWIGVDPFRSWITFSRTIGQLDV